MNEEPKSWSERSNYLRGDESDINASYNELRIEWHDGFSSGITCGFLAGLIVCVLFWWVA